MKKTFAGLLAVLMLMAVLVSGCKKTETSVTEDGKMKITVGFVDADESWKEDDYYKYIADKLNIDIEFQSLSADTAAEKARIWIASGSMPDVVKASFSMEEYINYGEQGVVRQLPKDWEEKYPNLGFSMEMTGILDSLEEAGDGRIHGLVVPTDHYYEFVDDFRQAYKEGKNLREMMGENQYKYIDKYGFAYRKDWAEKLGIETDYIMEYDAVIDMIRKFKEADLGNVGKTHVVGLAADHTEMPNFFITAFNSNYKYFHKDETGKYVCGLLEEETTQGLMEYAKAYREGIIPPGFYTQKSQDLNSLFCSQRSGVIFPRAEESALRKLNTEFEQANPGLKAEDCIGVCWVLSPDGKVHGREAGNYYGAYYFNPDISDEKMAKILELADYISSPEGGPQVRLGLPGIDYIEENGEYKIIREKNENGGYNALKEKYPSYEFFRNFLNPQYTHTTVIDRHARESMVNLLNAKREHELSLLDWDDKRDSYTAEDYVRFNASYEVNSMFAEVVVSEGDPAKIWEKKRKEIEKAAKPVVENMNASLVK